MTITIAEFSCHKDNSSYYTLSLERGFYKSKKYWFNSCKPTDTHEEVTSSLDFGTVVKVFLNSAHISLDTTKSYNHDVTDVQRQEIIKAVEDAKKYGQSIGVEE